MNPLTQVTPKPNILPPTPTGAFMTELKAPSAILMGDPGSGKSTAIVTLLMCGIEVFIVVTDPNGMDSILDAVRRDPKTRQPRKPEIVADLMSRLHWANAAPSPAGWGTLKEMSKIVSAMGYADIASLKQGIDKTHTGLIMSLLDNFENFADDRTGKSFGDVTKWDDSRALVIDSLSGINKMAKEHTAGFKPALHQGEWGIAMNLEEQLIFKLASDCQCYFIVTAHLDKVPNEVTGIPMVTVSALGNKLAPQLIKNFSEIIHTKRVNADFYWSTMENNMSVKNRALPISDKLQPDFKQIVDAHIARKQSLTA